MLHLSLVVVGGCLNGPVSVMRLALTIAAFFLAVGVGAHSLDELHGRPLGTSIPRGQLILAAYVGIGGAVALGIAALVVVGVWLVAFIIVGVIVAIAYNLELWGGRLHTRAVLVLGWGSFPVLTSYFAQHSTLSIAALCAGAFGALITTLQQLLSTPARALRRRTAAVEGSITLRDGTVSKLDVPTLLAPYEIALRVLCWSGVALALALAAARLL